MAFREKVVKASGKRVKTRQVSISSMKTRGEKTKAEVAEGVSAHPRQRKTLGKELRCRVSRINGWRWPGCAAEPPLLKELLMGNMES